MPTWVHAILSGIHTCGTTYKTTCKTMLAHKLARVSGVPGRTWAHGHMAHYQLARCNAVGDAMCSNAVLHSPMHMHP